MTIVKTIGVGTGLSVTPDFTTINDWGIYLATQSPLATPHIGRVLWASSANELVLPNQSLSSTISSDTTNTITLEAGDAAGNAGGSFNNNSNKLTNALRYNASNGACLRQTTGAGNTFLTIGAANVTIRNLQIAKSVDTSDVILLNGSAAVVDSCILAALSNIGFSAILENATSATLKNSLLYVSDASGVAIGCLVTGNLIASNCTVACVEALVNANFVFNSGASVLTNVAAFGGGPANRDYFVNGGTYSGFNNATDIATGSSGLTAALSPISQWNLVGTTEWVSVTQGSEDFRLNSTSVKLNNAGSSLGISTDIIGQIRS